MVACGGGAQVADGQTIGAEGGRIEIAGAYMDIPVGALNEELVMSIVDMGPSVDPLAFTPVFSFEPQDHVFALPIEVGVDAVGQSTAALQWSSDGVAYVPANTTYVGGSWMINDTTELGFAYGVMQGMPTTEETQVELPCVDCTIQIRQPDHDVCVQGLADDSGYQNHEVFGYDCGSEPPTTTQMPAITEWFLDQTMAGLKITEETRDLCLVMLPDGGGSMEVQLKPCAYNWPTGTAVYDVFEWQAVVGSDIGWLREPTTNQCLFLTASGSTSSSLELSGQPCTIEGTETAAGNSMLWSVDAM
jgi:hypothetical protein